MPSKRFGKGGLCRSTWMSLLFAIGIVGLAILIMVASGLVEKFTQTESDKVLPYDSPEQSMFILANNVCSPACCPSTFSCSGGCVCLTDTQKQLMTGSTKTTN